MMRPRMHVKITAGRELKKKKKRVHFYFYFTLLQVTIR
jgi:hypothetical protein